MKILLQWGILGKGNLRNVLQLKSDNKGDSGNGLQFFQWWKSDKWKFRQFVASVPAMEIGSNQCQTSANTKCKWKLQFLWEEKTFGRTIFVICSKKSYCVNISQQPKKCFSCLLNISWLLLFAQKTLFAILLLLVTQSLSFLLLFENYSG